MHVQLEELLETVRQHYLTAYRRAIRSYKERFKPGGPEVLLQLDRQVPLVYRHYRMDLASGAVDPPNLTEVNPDTHLEFEPLSFNYHGLRIFVSPFVWNGIEFAAAPRLSDDAGIQGWALKWLDLDERAEQDEDGLGAYIHSITTPQDHTNATTFSVDCGSAPVSSVLELFTVLRDSGVTSVDIHSRTVLGH